MAILKQKVGNTALNRTVIANYSDSTIVHKSGNETIAGTKTFTESPLVPTLADVSDNSTKAASTAFVQGVVQANSSSIRLAKVSITSTDSLAAGAYRVVDVPLSDIRTKLALQTGESILGDITTPVQAKTVRWNIIVSCYALSGSDTLKVIVYNIDKSLAADAGSIELYYLVVKQ